MGPVEQPTDATPFLPKRRSLAALREAAAGCRGCHLYAPATQTVFGEGLKRARVAMVGEMPGDREDREGHPFVGPAGRELDKALVAVGIDRREVYVTNVVKHFKFEERGKRRIHQRPKRPEVDACLPWLHAELDVVKPEALVLLGSHRRPGPAGLVLQAHPGARAAGRFRPGRPGDRHSPPLGDPARARRRGPPRRPPGLHARSGNRRAVSGRRARVIRRAAQAQRLARS